jgi:hypothetical protein
MHAKEFGVITLLPTDRQFCLTYRAFFPEDTDVQRFLVSTLALREICYITSGMEVNADEKKARGAFGLKDLVSDVKDNTHPKPFVEGKHIGERWLPTEHKWLEWGTARAPILFRRPRFAELFGVREKLMSVDMGAGLEQLRVVYDNQNFYHNHSAYCFVRWDSLAGVRDRSIKQRTRYHDEKPKRPDLPRREELEKISNRFDLKFLLGVMNSTVARDFLKANRRSNIHIYPDDWKELPIPDVSPEQQVSIIELVDKILAAKRKGLEKKVARLEKKLDQEVSLLYGVENERGDV